MTIEAAKLAEALRAIMREADRMKEPCGDDPESEAAIRNGKFATLAAMAAQGLGLVRGPPFIAQHSALRMAVTDADVESALNCYLHERECPNGMYTDNHKGMRAALKSFAASHSGDERQKREQAQRASFDPLQDKPR